MHPRPPAPTDPRSFRQRVLFPILAVALAAGFFFAVAELAFRLLPVRSGLQAQPVNDRTPYLHFRPNRRFTYSQGGTLSHVTRGTTNNYGFVAGYPYSRTDSAPLLAVVGDSYVEAQMVPHALTAAGRLHHCLRGRGRVYSFGASGAPLSQYVAYARFARDEFAPRALAVSVVGNDFDESLLQYKSAPGFHYYREDDGGGLRLARVDYAPSATGASLRRSALARYVLLNLGGLRAVRQPRDLESFVGQTSTDTSGARLQSSQRAVDQFLDDIPGAAGLPAARIVFLVDGLRPHLYQAELLRRAQASYAGRMREYFMAQARRRGFEVIDLQRVFMHAHARDGQRFETEPDAHWNVRGHGVAAHALAGSRVARSIFPAGFLEECRRPGP